MKVPEKSLYVKADFSELTKSQQMLGTEKVAEMQPKLNWEISY